MQALVCSYICCDSIVACWQVCKHWCVAIFAVIVLLLVGWCASAGVSYIGCDSIVACWLVCKHWCVAIFAVVLLLVGWCASAGV